MKLMILLCACFVAVAVTASAQWTQGVHYIGARVGLSYVGNAITPALDYEYTFTKPNVAGPGMVGAGVSVERYSQSETKTVGVSSTETNTNHLGILLYGTYHLGNLLDDKNMDLYLLFGLSALRNSGTQKVNNTTFDLESSTNFDVVGAAGFRYFFTPQFAGHIRAGFGVTTFSAGVTYGL